MKQFFLSIFLCLTFSGTMAQTALKPGFDPVEYKEMLEITAMQIDTPWTNHKGSLPFPEKYKFTYRSPVVGLKNQWDLWLRADSQVAVISIRGTTGDADSWMENFYAGMIPSSGKITIDTNYTFHYKLAQDTNAYVHAGWTLALAYLSPTLIQKINECYNSGVREFIILGHSQGGAIAFLTRSYFFYSKGVIPEGITFKTYCSAAPKPGNLYYAYDFDFITRNGWAYRVVNSADWVPEVPFSIQTVSDFNRVNPFKNLDKSLRKASLTKRIAVKYLYNDMSGSLNKAQKKFTKRLGKSVGKGVAKKLPDLKMPKYVNCQLYIPCGSPVILQAGSAEYNRRFDNVHPPHAFVNHMMQPYYFLLEEHYLKK